MKEIVVRIKDAVKMKEGRRAVHGVCMEVGSGELVAVQGKSGSGKTALFRLLAGIDKPDAGRVEVLGEPLSELSEEARRFSAGTGWGCWSSGRHFFLNFP